MENNNGNGIQYKGKSRNSWINDDTNNDNISDDGRNASKTTKQSTPVKNLSGNNNDNNRRISRWFVSNQKTEAWDENKLNKLHILIIALLLIMYTCHVVANPFVKVVEDQTFIIILKTVESICLVLGIVCLFLMWNVNGSFTAAKLLFEKKSVRTYIYIFWILRSFIIELLKGQILYSFVLVFHSIVIYSSDIWYLCNQKCLIFNVLVFLLVIVYEFCISISPFGPDKPSWMFMNIKTTANSLSRSNQFNIFVIFLDALIIIIYDLKRSKFVMLTKKRKRVTFIVSTDLKIKLTRLWKAAAFFACVNCVIFLLSNLLFPLQTVANIAMPFVFVVICSIYTTILWYSSTGSNAKKILCKLLQERRVLFMILLLGILFYIDNIFGNLSAAGIIFPLAMLMYMSLDIINGFFPKRVAQITVIVMVLVLVYCIFNHTLLKQDCTNENMMLKWGIYGQKISYCTIKRLIYQTVLSLIISAAIGTISGNSSKFVLIFIYNLIISLFFLSSLTFF